MPSDWLKANITPVFEKGSKHLAVNYRPISLTAVLCKILEHILHDIMAHLDANHILINSQHGFRRKFSCETQLINAIEEIGKALDNGKQTDVIIMDFSKAFDVICCTPSAINQHTGLLRYTWLPQGLANQFAYM